MMYMYYTTVCLMVESLCVRASCCVIHLPAYVPICSTANAMTLLLLVKRLYLVVIARCKKPATLQDTQCNTFDFVKGAGPLSWKARSPSHVYSRVTWSRSPGVGTTSC